MLEWAGISFGEQTNMLIQKSIEKLASTSKAQKLKLFGKVKCLERDYWVAQGVVNEVEEAPRNLRQEIRGKGVNSTVFWVTHDLKNDWVQLPEVQPEHITVAKTIKKMMTGNLDAKIDSCPPFPGNERHLLRAQLARIQHSTEICPKGLFEIDEDT